MPPVAFYRRGGLCAIAIALSLALPVASVRAAEKIFVELEKPGIAHEVRGPVPMVAVRGWAGSGFPGQHEVLLMIDRSESAFEPSGSDIDGDGRVGKRRVSIDQVVHYDKISNDPGDTILQAEVEAARRLIRRLDPETTRMGLMSFGGGATVHAPVGSSAKTLMRALSEMPSEYDAGGTNLDYALRIAREEFARQPKPESGARRYQSVILLSDGSPTTCGAPFPRRTCDRRHAEYFAVQEAKRAAAAGVRVYGFALGPEAVTNRAVFEEVTGSTGGDLVLVTRPGDVTDFVPHISLTKLARVRIDNLSSSEPARAVRLFPDGTFDGYAPLVPGKNLLRITAYGEDGYESVVDREVYFSRVDATTPEDVAALKEMLQELQVRTVETELAEEARRKLSANRSRSVEVNVD
jgi:hypothetical protein